jgi:protocatechuate 4,5-dioxygenase alpha chain
MKPENREKFKANEAEYLKPWKLTAAQSEAVLKRDYLAMMQNGGNIYFLAKLFSTDGFPYLVAVATMTGMSQEQYSNMMLAGGRSPKGVRSKSNPDL